MSTRCRLMMSSRVTRSLVSTVWAMAASAGTAVMAEGFGESRGLGPSPTGLAASAFSDVDPLRMSETSLRASQLSLTQPRPAVVNASGVGGVAAPAQRLITVPDDVDLFPITRRAVPLLVPNVQELAAELSSPARVMSGQSVGVRWRIPGHAR